MAKLDKEHQEQVNKASNEFPVAEPGVYHLRLMDVDTERSGAKGPYWSWKYQIIGDAEGPSEFDGMNVWNVTSLSENAAGIMKQTFEAFEVDSSTDTDDMCGGIVQGQLSVRTIQQGTRAGQNANQIDRLFPANPDFKPDSSVEQEHEKIF